MRSSKPEHDRPVRAGTARRPSGLSLRKKLLFSAAVTVVLLGLLELTFMLAGVQPAFDREDPYIGFSSYIPLFEEQRGRDGRTSMVTAPNKLSLFNEQRFPKRKARGTYRIFCMGGSTTYGRPYDHRTAFSAWLQELLARADPDPRYEVINAGGISYASYRVAKLMEELVRYQPDLFIIYTGQNEFLERRTYGSVAETPKAVQAAQSLLMRTRTYSAVRQLVRPSSAPVEGRELLPSEVKAILDSTIGPESYRRDDRVRQQVLDHFRFNLDRMVKTARSAGAEVVFVTPASNLRDCSPFKSEHRAGLGDSERRAWQAAFDEARRAYEAGDHGASLAAVERALAIDPRYAHAHYLHGRVLLALDRFDEARRAFVRAREEDVCPLRALTQIEAIVRDAARENDVPMVDFAGIVARRSPHGIPGEDLFLDHVHPTIEAHGLLAAALLEKMSEIEAVELPTRWSTDDVQAVAERINGRIDNAYRAAALRNLAKVLGWAGKGEEAAALALKAAELNSGDAEAQYEAGNALFRAGDFAGALARYERSRELGPHSAQAYYGLGLAHGELGHTEQAIAAYRTALRYNPEFADAHYNLGNLLMSRGEWAGAQDHYRAALRITPRDVYALNNLGLILWKSGDRPAAQARFEEALRINAEFPDALFNLARLHEESGNRAAAVRYYRALLQIQPDNSPAAQRLDALQ